MAPGVSIWPSHRRLRRGRCFADTDRMMSLPRPVERSGDFDCAIAWTMSASTSGRPQRRDELVAALACRWRCAMGIPAAGRADL